MNTMRINNNIEFWKPDYTIKFMSNGEIIGTLDFNKKPATFVGDVDESAKIFCETVLNMMPIMVDHLYHLYHLNHKLI